ncbi:TetR/AcrR family transcriptional regulator [Aureimonas phyllosphaerae]|uniref:AcrR family transcriptional regulator n=1 Tax=Aureimonas phyllosphaerae TaxID=1166078 RepID=A0A7W6BWM7_9HYPH|nr:TetR/AcrR family transcriptional regulator [Aureimonas phyllosphaerae]MBB3937404.1 AcrR family transcriptional regulator [Aureimonas phyllosphaerae]MBB3961530.1 AcrR family transcriptional regulator [Aureimonas phyllosphaerae]SFF39092.1 transcriptional regulator, TetR family [Aureimonas phyllosphaerae]
MTAILDLVQTPSASSDRRAAAGEDPTKRRQILEGARRAFVGLGFDAASMNDVVREAGVSKSTLYVYFRSKEELFRALIECEREAYLAEVEALLTDPGDPAETLLRYGQRLARLVMSPEAMHAKRTVIAVAARMPEVGREFYRHGPQRGLALLSAYLEKACAAGTLEIPDVALAAAQFVELATAGILRRRFFDDEAPAISEDEMARVVASAVRLFMAGYGPRRT